MAQEALKPFYEHLAHIRSSPPTSAEQVLEEFLKKIDEMIDIQQECCEANPCSSEHATLEALCYVKKTFLELRQRGREQE